MAAQTLKIPVADNNAALAPATVTAAPADETRPVFRPAGRVPAHALVLKKDGQKLPYRKKPPALHHRAGVFYNENPFSRKKARGNRFTGEAPEDERVMREDKGGARPFMSSTPSVSPADPPGLSPS
jgi:hypothetical protein